MTTTTKICVLCACTIWCTACKSTDKLTHTDNDIHISDLHTWGSLSRYDLHLFDTIDVWPIPAADDTATGARQPYRTIRHTRLDAVVAEQDTSQQSTSIQQKQTTTTTKKENTFHNFYSQCKCFYAAVFIVVFIVLTIRYKR